MAVVFVIIWVVLMAMVFIFLLLLNSAQKDLYRNGCYAIDSWRLYGELFFESLKEISKIDEDVAERLLDELNRKEIELAYRHSEYLTTSRLGAADRFRRNLSRLSRRDGMMDG